MSFEHKAQYRHSSLLAVTSDCHQGASGRGSISGGSVFAISSSSLSRSALGAFGESASTNREAPFLHNGEGPRSSQASMSSASVNRWQCRALNRKSLESFSIFPEPQQPASQATASPRHLPALRPLAKQRHRPSRASLRSATSSSKRSCIHAFGHIGSGMDQTRGVELQGTA